jgi:uncharacterized repeat protein (TIGR04052 family)
MPSTVKILLTLLSMAVIQACAPPAQTVEIRFDVRFDGAPISCARSSDRALTDLRFYVHDVKLTTERGNAVTVSLATDGIWQNPAVALLDFEDGSGACENGSGPVNHTIRGTARIRQDDPIRALAFTIGVPETLNHANAVTAEPPLAYTIMHWHWKSGYKFMRAGVELDNDLAWLHLGSAKCAGTIGDIRGCAAANRPVVELDDFDPASDRVIVDVARLLGPSLLGDGVHWSCESGPDEVHCRVVFAELGLDFDSGESLGSAPAFYKERR